jgi:hypothetical protein
MYPKRRWTDNAQPAEVTSIPQKIGRETTALGTLASWPFRIGQEIRYRLRLAICAPSAKAAKELERGRVHSERQRLAEEYSQGYLDGWHECYAACLAAVEDEVSRSAELWAAGDVLTRLENSSQTN